MKPFAKGSHVVLVACAMAISLALAGCSAPAASSSSPSSASSSTSTALASAVSTSAAPSVSGAPHSQMTVDLMENIATNTPDVYEGHIQVFEKLLRDENDKVRMEAPEMFRVLGKRRL